MKLLRCLLCRGELDIIDEDFFVNKKVKCRDCGFNNKNVDKKSPEITIIRKRPST